MADTEIGWTDVVWNPVRGCSRVSPGCVNCYAERSAAHPWRGGPGKAYHGLTVRNGAGEPRWTGEVRFVPEKLAEPLGWRKPRRVFVNSMSDLFHEEMSIGNIARIWAVMLITSLHDTRGGHTYQILTKRAERMREILLDEQFADYVVQAGAAMMEDGDNWSDALAQHIRKSDVTHPLIWLGVSVENQATAMERIPFLLTTPAAVRWLSVEPLLEQVTIPHVWLGPPGGTDRLQDGVDWVVVGGESGPGRRDCGVEPILSIVRQCKAADVACYVKQDSGPKAGMQGRIPDDVWSTKQFPEVT